ncbi:MAG: glycosyltransferase family 4 protein [Candidatus Helarchaeota archaeon]
MNILFIVRENKQNNISPIILAQGQSLKNEGCKVDYFLIRGKGLMGYVSNIIPLRKYLKNNKNEIIHAHFSFSAIIAAIAGAKSLVVSLMGSDVYSNCFMRQIIKCFNNLCWDKCIVKSEKMKNILGISNTEILPNGVDTEIFRPIPKDKAKYELNLDYKKKYILFAANPNKYVKNFSFFINVFNKLDKRYYRYIVLQGVPHYEIPFYMNAAEVVVLTSLWEGSPNVIKEAMACNCPIVSTDVGDVKRLLDGIDGCYTSSLDVNEFFGKLNKSLIYSQKYKKTLGRTRILKLGLTSKEVACKLINIYKAIC